MLWEDVCWISHPPKTRCHDLKKKWRFLSDDDKLQLLSQAVFALEVLPATHFYNRSVETSFTNFLEKVRVDHHPKESFSNLFGKMVEFNDFQEQKSQIFRAPDKRTESVPRDPHEVPKWEVASQMAFHTPPVHAALFPGGSVYWKTGKSWGTTKNWLCVFFRNLPPNIQEFFLDR